MRQHALRGLSLAILLALIMFGLVALLFLEGSVIAPTYWTDLAVGVTLLAITTLSWGLKPYFVRWVKGEKEDAFSESEKSPEPAHIQENTTWFSKFFQEVSFERGLRDNVWLAMVILAIFGATAIAIAISFLSTTALQKTTFVFLEIYTMISAGILFITLSALFMITELMAMRKNQQMLIIKRNNAYKNQIDTFREALDAVQETSDLDLKTEMLSNFQDKLLNLCQNYKWMEVKEQIEETLNCLIPENLFNEPKPHGKRYVQILSIIIGNFGEHVTLTINKRWLKDINKFYEDPNYDTTSISNVLSILLQLHGYSKNYLIKIVEDATMWSKLKWQILANNFEVAFSEIKKRDYTGYKEIVSYLRLKMESSKKQNSEISFERLHTLYKMATR